MNLLNECLLTSWLRLSTSINNARIVSDMTYNESLICNILYNNSLDSDSPRLTATDLCTKTKILKSQMNRTLNQLERKNMITRERSSIDKRNIYISMNAKQSEIYKLQHKKILELIDVIISNLGTEDSIKAIDLFNTISNIADNLKLG